MKNPMQLLFWPVLASLVLLAGCYYPYYPYDGNYIYGGYGYRAGYAWPAYYGYYPYPGYAYDSVWLWGGSSYTYQPYRWRDWRAPVYRPGAPYYYRPDTPRYRPGWRDYQGGPRQPGGPAFRPDTPNVRPPDGRPPRPPFRR